MKVFEVDQEQVQRRKIAKLPNALRTSDHVSYVSVDFNHQSLKTQLLNAGFDTSKSSVFTLEGVSQYITKSGLRSTLSELAELTESNSSTFFMSYVDYRLRDDPKACFGPGYPWPKRVAATIMKLSAKVGEPWISFYSAEEIREMLNEYDFSVVQNKNLRRSQ
jgi:methyltransferase (TIGR00027 family)